MSLDVLLEASALQTAMAAQNKLIIIDLSSDENYQQAHIPGAIHIKPAQLSAGTKPAPGLLPSMQDLQQLMRSIGLKPDSHVVCYDDAAGSWAGRFIWTLDLIGHCHSSLLNGGLNAWLAEGYATSCEPCLVSPSDCTVKAIKQQLIVDTDDILAHLNDPSQCIWDVRSLDEYTGAKALAARGGHIPGAVHLEWTELYDEHAKLRPLPELQARLNAHGITADKRIITHCQTHRRSGLSYFVAKKLLGYNIAAYPGSWSQWGNDESLPVANSLPQTRTNT
jgi:thiosulfate/3-mercaptopyruvate sulfurtransferase